jgi:deoxyribonuclease V
MKLSHRWDLDYEEAQEVQKQLAKHVISRNTVGKIERIAGVDVEYTGDTRMAIAAVLVFHYPDLSVIEAEISAGPVEFPYIPGLLSFREGPTIMECFSKIKNTPDLVLFDGHGYMHPRRLGLASHLGVLLGLPSIGVAKSSLHGEFPPPGSKRGEYSYVIDRGETIGAAVTTRDNTRPVFVSVGTKVSLEFAINIAVSLSRYRVPEPIRQAHICLKNQPF